MGSTCKPSLWVRREGNSRLGGHRDSRTEWRGSTPSAMKFLVFATFRRPIMAQSQMVQYLVDGFRERPELESKWSTSTRGYRAIFRTSARREVARCFSCSNIAGKLLPRGCAPESGPCTSRVHPSAPRW